MRFNSRHATHNRPAPRSGHTSRPLTLRARWFATRRGHSFFQQNSSDRTSNLTPRITRRPASLREDEMIRVGGRVHALVMRRPSPDVTRTRRNPSLPSGHIKAAHPSAIPRHNAAHHAPAHKIDLHDINRVAGRVHALVRLRPPLAHLPPPASRGLAFNSRHDPRQRLPSRSGQTLRLATLRSGRSATRRGRAFN